MLCLPILDQFGAAGANSVPMKQQQQQQQQQQHAAPATPFSTIIIRNNSLNNNSSSNNSTPTNSSLYSNPLPPSQPHMPQILDSFTATPSSSTPCSLPAVRSWQPLSANNITPTTFNTTPKQPLILDSSTANKINLVENLVDTAAMIIESIWPSPLGIQSSTKVPVIPLHIFVKETLRRSRTTLSTLQLALYYIYKVRNQVLAAQEKIRQDQRQHRQSQPLSPNMEEDAQVHQRDYFNPISLHVHTPTKKSHTLPLTPPGTNNTPASLSPLPLSSTTTTSPILAKSEPVGCGRRMFLAALILASKFQQDRTYSNKAWSKISGLPVSEINVNEITFLNLIDYRLFVSHIVFQKWVTILTEKGNKFRERVNLSRSCTSTPINTDAQPTRRSSIQYCTNTLPSRMTCVTASSLEQQQQQQQQQFRSNSAAAHPHNLAPHLPSFALFVGEQLKQTQFDFSVPSGVSALPKLSMENSVSTLPISGLIQPESIPRQQQGMGSYLTHRWVQAQRREFLKSRMQSMGYTLSDTSNVQSCVPLTQSPQPLSQQYAVQHGQTYDTVLNNFQNNVITYSQTRTYSLDRMHPQQAAAATKPNLVEEKSKYGQCFMPSPVSSPSPKGLAGAKRRMTDDVDADVTDDRTRTRRRLSVSFLVDC
ncbi:hypothetical protein BG011_001529 [Mortierella polycephala]|uniref:G1/S-specific cyclin pas1 n=1 Tax=Mortierella polycephala TaxID=41804 RepID=A0A9P6Q6D1_9FUNG|nr:hypothetical protein BG011_001529 [Mortierella polycephala]